MIKVPLWKNVGLLPYNLVKTHHYTVKYNKVKIKWKVLYSEVGKAF